ncbi:hypothetical protein LX81_02551 [Palleronia aestuarii]|uniref:SnoaL-like protein n=1 Tax=Palleronia aestuarii TaxID=568105 RepID=A0A2W7N5D1_9RHOB|nr:hypothetical protein [Palleronia aestuarii]PZX15248.1 hypothetical protein LX81_02551 [Palleronia aestuarii]
MPAVPFQEWLDKVGDCYLTGDFDAYCSCFELPIAFITDQALTMIADETSLRSGFDAWRRMLESQRMTHMIRIARDVHVLSGSLISGVYVTHLMKDANRICPEFNSSATLRLVDGEWRAMGVTWGLSNASFPIVVPRVKP